VLDVFHWKEKIRFMLRDWSVIYVVAAGGHFFEVTTWPQNVTIEVLLSCPLLLLSQASSAGGRGQGLLLFLR
jgi:hypothetical protein